MGVSVGDELWGRADVGVDLILDCWISYGIGAEGVRRSRNRGEGIEGVACT
jgi:hypothetical protein